MNEKIKTSKIIEIENKIKPYLEEENFSLVEVEYSEKENSLVVLNIYNEKNTTIEKLGKINKKLYPVLDELPFLKDNFSLEVSSPGIYRKIQFFEEFNIFRGKKVIIKSEDSNIYQGTLTGLNNNEVSITDKNGKKIILSLKNIKNASLDG